MNDPMRSTVIVAGTHQTVLYLRLFASELPKALDQGRVVCDWATRNRSPAALSFTKLGGPRLPGISKGV